METNQEALAVLIGSPTTPLSGYSIANGYVDASILKDFWQRNASLTLSINDILQTCKNVTHTASDLFIQDSNFIRNPQLAPLNFSYRFGKMDASLFRRKNTNVNNQGNDVMGN